MKKVKMENAKILDSDEEMRLMKDRIPEFQIIHNTYMQDAFLIITHLDANLHDTPKMQSYYRSLVNIFLYVIEADIFYYNQFDKYPKYSDRHSFKEKIDGTFPQICKTWKREDLLNEYFKDNYDILIKLKDRRNNLAHPKQLGHLFKATLEDDAELKTAIANYDAFIRSLMANFFFERHFASVEDMLKVMGDLFPSELANLVSTEENGEFIKYKFE